MHNTLEVYYNKIRPDEEIMAYWWELNHALLRLQFSVEEFEKAMGKLQDLQSIYRVHYQLQNYYTCVYEFAERLYAFLVALIDGKETSKKTLKARIKRIKTKLRDPNQHGGVFSDLSKISETSVSPLKQILELLDENLNARCINTHESFIRLRFNEGFRWIDIEDIWWDLEEDNTVLMRKIFKTVSKQGMQLVKEQKLTTEDIHKNLNKFFKELPLYQGSNVYQSNTANR